MTLVPLLVSLVACSNPPAPAPSPAAEPVHEHGAHDEVEPAAAEEGHSHARPSHGGTIQTVDGLRVEALMMPSGVMFFLSDLDSTPLVVDGYSGSAVVTGPGGSATVDLMAMGDHLHAPAAFVQGEPGAVVLNLTHDGKAINASFKSASVGLQSHDHTALHGGQVGMWGDIHLEYATSKGEYRVWVTDGHRNPLPGATGSIKDGATTVPLTAAPDGALLGRGDGAGTRPVSVEVIVAEQTVTLAFNAVGTPSMPGI